MTQIPKQARAYPENIPQGITSISSSMQAPPNYPMEILVKNGQFAMHNPYLSSAIVTTKETAYSSQSFKQVSEPQIMPPPGRVQETSKVCAIIFIYMLNSLHD